MNCNSLKSITRKKKKDAQFIKVIITTIEGKIVNERSIEKKR